MTPRFEAAFIQCLKDGVYPGPANLNQRFRADGKRFNRLNGKYTKMRLALMYLFGVPYVRGNIDYTLSSSDGLHTQYTAGEIPKWPYLHSGLASLSDYPDPPVQGSRKHEIQNPNEPWELKHK